MKILVTGTEGYIGARLAPWLRAHGPRGHRAGHRLLPRRLPVPRPARPAAGAAHRLQGPAHASRRRTSKASTRSIHLAELSNDPLGQNRPEITFKINHEGSVRIAQAAREAGVRRFVYASSCSVYGVGTGEFLDETSPTNPQTAYAQCKVLRRARPRADGRRRLLRGVPAQRHRLRAVAAHALRHRAQRPVRAGLDAEEDRDDQRRQPLAADRAHRGHLRGDALRARGAGRCRQRRGLQRRRHARELPRPRDRADRRRGLPGLRGQRRPAERGQPQLPRLVRQDRDAAARLQGALDRASAAPRSCGGCSSASSSRARPTSSAPSRA